MLKKTLSILLTLCLILGTMTIAMASTQAQTTIKGTVKYLHQPVSGALLNVYLKGNTNVYKTINTDRYGKFSINLERGKTYDFTVQKDNYLGFSQFYAKNSTASTVINLVTGLKVKGSLIDRTGKPLKNTKLCFTSGFSFLTTTDAYGNFILNLYPNKEYFVRCLIKGLENQTLATFKLINKEINLGKIKANYGTVTPPPTTTITPPKAPDLTITKHYKDVILKWTPSEDVDYFKVKRGTKPGELSELISNLKGNTYIDTTTEDKVYYYTVIAVKNGKESPDSNVVIRQLPPEAPFLMGQREGKNVRLLWTKPIGTEKFIVYRANNLGGPYLYYFETPYPYFYDEKTEFGVSYAYQVKAINSYGESKGSNEIGFIAAYPPTGEPEESKYIIEDNDEYALAKLNSDQMPNITYSEETGIPEFIDGNYSSNKVKSVRDAIYSLNSVRTLMKIEDPEREFVLDKTVSMDGLDTYRLQQVYKGIPVYGRQLLVNVNQDKVTSSLNGNYVPEVHDGLVDITPRISINEAKEKALQYAGLTAVSGSVNETRLVIYSLNETGPGLSWQIEVSGNPSIGKPVALRIFVNALNGSIIDKETRRYNETISVNGSGVGVLGGTPKNFYVSETSGRNYQYYEMIDMNRKISTLDSRNNTVFTNLLNEWDDRAAVDAHYNAKVVYDYYNTKLGRKSYDDQGGPINLLVHGFYTYRNNNGQIINDPNNAFWDPDMENFTFGDGDGNRFRPLSAALDVVGHEFTHGVVDHTAKLIYSNQSGALNEAFADIFGNLIEHWNGKVDPNWLLGEDCYTPNDVGDALRYMSDPNITGDPDNMGDYRESTNDEDGDYGGVHTNSSIINKAFYNMWKNVYGGNESKNDLLAKIWYRSLVSYLGQTSDFKHCRAGVLQAAKDLSSEHNITRDQLNGMAKAFDDVGIYGPTDLKSGTWFYDYFIAALSRNIISGIGVDNTPLSNIAVQPYKSMTGAEFIVTLIRAAGLEGELPTNITVNSWQSHWAKGYLQLAYNHSWIHPDSFRNPDQPITRQDAGHLLWVVFNDNANKNKNQMKLKSYYGPWLPTSIFTDASDIHYQYVDEMIQLNKNGIFTGYLNPDKVTKRLAPREIVDRATCCAMVMKCFKGIK